MNKNLEEENVDCTCKLMVSHFYKTDGKYEMKFWLIPNISRVRHPFCRKIIIKAPTYFFKTETSLPLLRITCDPTLTIVFHHATTIKCTYFSFLVSCISLNYCRLSAMGKNGKFTHLPTPYHTCLAYFH